MDLLVEENKDIEGYAPISMGQNIPHYWLDHIVPAFYGVDYYATMTGTDGLNKTAEALLKLQEVKKYMSYNAEESDATAGFLNNTYTFLLDGSWAMGNIVNEETAIDADLVDVFPFPAVKEEVGNPLLSGYTSGFYITRKAWNDPAKRVKAVEFISMQTSRATLIKYAENGGFASDPSATAGTPSSLALKLAALSGRADVNVLPLGDSSAPDTYTTLVEGQGAFFNGNEKDAKDVIQDYLDAQK